MCIIIYSNPIHTGKTQKLFAWCQQQTNAAGILMPIINGKRCFYNIQNKTYFQAEADSLYKNEVWQIGKYSFSQVAFAQANTTIIKAISENRDWVIIDEIGFLELEQKGFYTAWQFAIQAIQNQQFNKHLVVVVRGNLLQQVIRNVKDLPYKVVHNWQAI